MKSKVKEVIEDGLVGAGIGTAAIIPGISGATIALIFGKFKKIVNSVSHLLSKQFGKNFLILLPFGIGLVIAIIALIKPFQLAFDYCMFAIVCLFAAFIVGSLPSVFDNVKGNKPTKINIIVCVIAFLVATAIGVCSVFFDFHTQVENLFAETPFYLYIILFFLGILSASGVTVPGFSASMLLLVCGFYKPILNLVHIDAIKQNPGRFCGLIGCFAAGVIVGFFLFSKLMNFLLDNHKQTTHYAIIGFILGSLVSIFVNSDMFYYLSTTKSSQGNIAILDWILAPIFIVVGIGIGILIVIFSRKKMKQEELQLEEQKSVEIEEK